MYARHVRRIVQTSGVAKSGPCTQAFILKWYFLNDQSIWVSLNIFAAQLVNSAQLYSSQLDCVTSSSSIQKHFSFRRWVMINVQARLLDQRNVLEDRLWLGDITATAASLGAPGTSRWRSRLLPWLTPWWSDGYCEKKWKKKREREIQLYVLMYQKIRHRCSSNYESELRKPRSFS